MTDPERDVWINTIRSVEAERDRLRGEIDRLRAALERIVAANKRASSINARWVDFRDRRDAIDAAREVLLGN